MRERDDVTCDDVRVKDGSPMPTNVSPKDVIRAYNILRYRQIKEKYNGYGSITRQFGIEK